MEHTGEYTEDQVQDIARHILQQLPADSEKATILALQGDVGAGKTTLTKALAKELGIEETVISPTFVIAKFYEPKKDFDHLIHIDAYRIESNDELQPLRWEEVLQQPCTLIVVEWPERIADMLPAHTQYFVITHNGDKRTINKYEK